MASGSTFLCPAGTSKMQQNFKHIDSICETGHCFATMLAVNYMEKGVSLITINYNGLVGWFPFFNLITFSERLLLKVG